ncbi:MAG: formylmethanofuran dehydrogenase subunit C [Pirellulaceae bacterium]
MTLQLTWRGGGSVPVEVEDVTPDRLIGMTNDEIEQVDIFEGKRKTQLAEFFDVSGDLDDQQMVWQGDLGGVHWVGAKMVSGTMRVEGDVGRHLGSEMKGGAIHVTGNASDWVGGEMKGGQITVQGNAGHLVGAAYRGSARGMTGGTIEIYGSAGNEIGHTMRRGLIAIGTKVGDLVGFNMLAGSIFMFGDSGIRHGAGMRRGTLAFFSGELPSMLPTFRHACRFRSPAINLITNQLADNGFAVAEAHRGAMFDLYHGDMIEGGRGEILVRSE